tara:strand:+ start:111 stop:311 length:201 start_codon:yes stop_codon:yes gene_type:complete
MMKQQKQLAKFIVDNRERLTKICDALTTYAVLSQAGTDKKLDPLREVFLCRSGVTMKEVKEIMEKI